jgi:MoaA/NifB/PqqE/SkfB family radical SAM enzyme
MRPSIGWQFRFLRGFLSSNIAEASPFAMLVDVTQRCNLNCLHCRFHSPLAPAPRQDEGRSDFPLDRFLALCREAREWGIRKVTLIGEGEPLLHPGLLEMVAAAKAAGCRVMLVTNGTLLGAKLAEELISAGLDEIMVSLWASDEEEYRSLNPGTRPEMFQRTVAGLQAVASAKRARRSPVPRLVLHRVIEARFFQNLEKTVDIARKTGCDAVSFSPLRPMLPADRNRSLTPEGEQELVQVLAHAGRKAQAAGLAHNISEVLQRLNLGRAVWKKLPCYIGWVDIRLKVNGDVLPCNSCQWVMGNIHRDGIREIWNNLDYQEFRRLSRRPEGIMHSRRPCLCDFCCNAVTNARLHRLLRWVSPATAALQRTPA